jgi:SPP1 gp7 family putative phage head morphogenesis protein
MTKGAVINRAKLFARLAKNKRKVKGIKPDKTIEIKYRKTLLSLVREIGAFNLSFIKALDGLVKDSKFTDYDTVFNQRFSKHIDSLSKNYSEKFVGQSDAAHKKAFIAEINSKIGINLTDILKNKADRVGRVVTHRIKENSDLIKSLAGDFKQQARDAIHETLLNGDTSETLRAKLEHIEGVTESRAELIARDQTQKVCSDLNQARQKDVGITGYYWSGIDDGRERDTHIENNGLRFDWNSPPAETGHPGEDINCRCTADPDLTGFLENLPDE